MDDRSLRLWLRWTHLTLGLLIAGWLYSPWIDDPQFVTAVRFLLVPFLGVTGLWMWQIHALSKPTAAPPVSSRSETSPDQP